MDSTRIIDLSVVLANAPRECWLALNEDESRILGRGETIKDAVEEARKAGVEDPIIIWSPKSWTPRVLRG